MKNYTEIDWSTGKTIVIDFRSDTCGPCRQVAKIIDGMNSDKADFYECSIDEDGTEDMMEKYAIRTVPTLVFIKDGAVVARNVGATTADKINEILDSIA